MQALLEEYQQQTASTSSSDDLLRKEFVLSDYALEQIVKIHRILSTPDWATHVRHHLLLVASLGNRLSMLVRMALFVTGAGAASGVDKVIRPVTLSIGAKATVFEQCRAAFRSVLTENRKIALIFNVSPLFLIYNCPNF